MIPGKPPSYRAPTRIFLAPSRPIKSMLRASAHVMAVKIVRIWRESRRGKWLRQNGWGGVELPSRSDQRLWMQSKLEAMASCAHKARIEYKLEDMCSVSMLKMHSSVPSVDANFSVHCVPLQAGPKYLMLQKNLEMIALLDTRNWPAFLHNEISPCLLWRPSR